MPHADPRYPIGPAPAVGELSRPEREEALRAIAALPGELRLAVGGLSEVQLDTPYREGGWTVRQLVHHIADSHLNAYTRVKLALTEAQPTIKPYDEAAWAELPDSALPVSISLTLLDALHARWSALLAGLGEEQWECTFVHPASQQTLSVAQASAQYRWHGQHHTAQIKRLRAERGW
nr:putative metal-dependent hydrolase [Deinococcus irradiatisoli]